MIEIIPRKFEYTWKNRIGNIIFETNDEAFEFTCEALDPISSWLTLWTLWSRRFVDDDRPIDRSIVSRRSGQYVVKRIPARPFPIASSFWLRAASSQFLSHFHASRSSCSSFRSFTSRRIPLESETNVLLSRSR